MNKTILFSLSGLILLSGVMPVFAEVIQLQLDQKSYFKGEFINVQGEVKDDASGLVTIVLRDPNDKFVLLSQAIIQADSSFEKAIPIEEKFQVIGTYNATAFVLNMTAGKTQSFDLLNGIHEKKIISEDVISDNLDFEMDVLEPMIIEPSFETPQIIEKPTEVEFEVNEPSEISMDDKSTIADFVDKSKDPQYYLDRYYSEPGYKSWFDRNYPDLTIENAVGYNIPLTHKDESNTNILDTEIIPQAQAASISSSNTKSKDNSEFAQLGLAIGGLAVLFGAVYGVKRKVDNNSRHISINKDMIKRKIISPIIDSNPLGIIQTRLAKGEISIDEYEKLKQKLDNSR